MEMGCDEPLAAPRRGVVDRGNGPADDSLRGGHNVNKMCGCTDPVRDDDHLRDSKH